MKNVSIIEALRFSFKSMKQNLDVLKRLYCIEFAFLLTLSIISFLIEKMNAIGTIIGTILIVFILIFYTILLISFEWNVIFHGIKYKRLKLKDPFLWKNFGDYFVISLLMSLLIFFAIMLPFFIALIGIGYGINKIANNFVVSMISIVIPMTIFSIFMSVKLFFLKYIIASRIIKNKKMRYWNSIKESFNLTKGIFWKILLLILIIFTISMVISLIPYFINQILTLLNPDLTFVKILIDDLITPIISIFTQMLTIVSGLYIYKEVKTP